MRKLFTTIFVATLTVCCIAETASAKEVYRGRKIQRLSNERFLNSKAFAIPSRSPSSSSYDTGSMGGWASMTGFGG